jgi:hypothetical protein
MRLITLTDAAANYLSAGPEPSSAEVRASEIDDQADGRRTRVPVALLAQSGQVEATAAWSRWDWCRWGAPYVALGLLLGAAIDLLARVCAS